MRHLLGAVMLVISVLPASAQSSRAAQGGSTAEGLQAAGEPRIHTSVDTTTYQDGNTSVRTGIMTDNGPVIVRSDTYGAERDAATLSVMSNFAPRNSTNGIENRLEIMGGFNTPANRYSAYPLLDSVATSIGITSPHYVGSNLAGTFDLKHFYPRTALTSAQVASLQNNMWVRTSTGFQGLLKGWAADGTSLVVDAWTQAAVPVPAGGVGSVIPAGTVTINANDNIYADNTNVYCNRPDMVQCTAYEIGVLNQTGGYTSGGLDPRSDRPLADAYHGFCQGAGVGQDCTAYQAAYPGSQSKGTTDWHYSFVAASGKVAGLYCIPIGVLGACVESVQSSGLVLNVAPNGTTRETISYNGGINAYDTGSNLTFQMNPDSGTLYTKASVQTGVTTVAGLGACSGANEGTRRAVSDAASPTFLGVLTGGGTVHSPAYCNGSAWIAG